MMLPTEVLDIVFSKIHLKTAAPTFDSQATFSSLCLSSKHFLPLAREYLYYQPFTRSSRIGWKTATTFSEALEAHGGILGQLVRNLEGLVHCLVALEEIDDSTRLRNIPPGSGVSSRAYTWLLDILRSCSCLVKVDITFNSSNPRHALKAIERYGATLRHVNVLNGKKVFEAVRGAKPSSRDDYYYFATGAMILFALVPLQYVDQFDVEDPQGSVAFSVDYVRRHGCLPLYPGPESPFWRKLRLHS